MEQLANPAAVRELCRRHGFTFSKSLGQNFLINPSVCPRMAKLCGADQDTGVLEIGAGFGVLTRELACAASKVLCVELDRRLLSVLTETLADCPNVALHQGDVLKVDLSALLSQHFPGQKIVVCANLPYYITSPVIMELLTQNLPISSITVMVQKEVAQRLCAPVGSREAGAVTVAAANFAQARRLFDVSRGSFFPAPKVDSAVIRLDLRDKPACPVPPQHFSKVVSAAFSMRRKTLLNCLAQSFSVSKTVAAHWIANTGLPPNIRGEQLSLEQFSLLSQKILLHMSNG